MCAARRSASGRPARCARRIRGSPTSTRSPSGGKSWRATGSRIFTGIVQGVRRVARVEGGARAVALEVDLADLAAGLDTGASVAIDGVCVTAAAVRGGTARFDLIRETARQTNLGDLRAGSLVNVERSLRFGDEVGGHILSGHVATTVRVARVEAEADHRLIEVTAPQQWSRYLMAKGFVALNGASLTIQELDRQRGAFTVSLIPETLQRTTFDAVAPGDRLNLEVDAHTQAVVDTVRSMLPELAAELAPSR